MLNQNGLNSNNRTKEPFCPLLSILANVVPEIVQTETGENKVSQCFDASYAMHIKLKWHN